MTATQIEATDMEQRAAIERRNGVAVWRQIADRIRQGIADGSFPQGSRLPAEIVLAERLGVNRHTVRGAIAALAREGVLRAEQGRGTFVERTARIAYALGRRTRFSANLEGQAREARSRLLAHRHMEADARLAALLDLDPGAPVLRLDIIGEADGRAISRTVSWVDAARFPRMVEICSETGSMTAAFARHGIANYHRRSTTVTARHAEPSSLAELALSPGAIMLVAAAIDEDTDGRAIQYAETLFPADRVELTVR